MAKAMYPTKVRVEDLDKLRMVAVARMDAHPKFLDWLGGWAHREIVRRNQCDEGEPIEPEPVERIDVSAWTTAELAGAVVIAISILSVLDPPTAAIVAEIAADMAGALQMRAMLYERTCEKFLPGEVLTALRGALAES